MNLSFIYSQLREITKIQKYDDPKDKLNIDGLTKLTKWNGYQVVICYDPVILCNKKDLRNELHASWAKINKLCMTDYEKSQKDNE